MPVKCTLLFQANTGPAANEPGPGRRTGGFSETYIFPGDTVADAEQHVAATVVPPAGKKSLALTRAKLLPDQCFIIGLRLQPINPLGRAVVREFSVVGTAGDPTDSPQIALQYKVLTTGRNVAHRYLHNFPDEWCQFGELKLVPAFQTAFTDFGVALGSFAISGRDLTKPTVPILTVSTAGVATLETSFSVEEGAFVRVLRSQDSCGRLRGGRYRVATVAEGGRILTLDHWLWGPSEGGAVRVDAVRTNTITTIEYERVGIKKIGRPFHLFRGRASNRH